MLLGGSSDLNVWIRNDLESPVDYEISVDDFEKSGSLEGADTDTYEDVIARGSGEPVDVSVRFGIRSGGEFEELATGGSRLMVQDETKAVFARYSEVGAFYGLTDDG